MITTRIRPIHTTREEYCKKVKNPEQDVQENLYMDDFYDDEYDFADDYEDADYDYSTSESINSEDHVSDSCDNVNEQNSSEKMIHTDT